MAPTDNINDSYLIKQDSLLPPARECRCSHALNAESQSALCSAPSEDLYLHTKKNSNENQNFIEKRHLEKQ